jgi:hypothetical protein
MAHGAQAHRLNVLVVHHDAVVLEDLCETLSESAGEAVVDRAEILLPGEIGGKIYDAALIEVSRNATAFEEAFDALSGALGLVVWITDDMHPAPDAPLRRASLRQPFRTEDVTAALRAAGVVRPGPAPQGT